jgi:hypothetical protein
MLILKTRREVWKSEIAVQTRQAPARAMKRNRKVGLIQNRYQKKRGPLRATTDMNKKVQQSKGAATAASRKK